MRVDGPYDRDEFEETTQRMREYVASHGMDLTTFTADVVRPYVHGASIELERSFVSIWQSRITWQRIALASWATTIGFIVSMFVFN